MNDLLAEQGLDAYRQETQAVHNAYLAMTETAIARWRKTHPLAGARHPGHRRRCAGGRKPGAGAGATGRDLSGDAHIHALPRKRPPSRECAVCGRS